VSDKDELLYENMRHLDFLKIDHLRTELAKRTAERDKTRRLYCIEMSRQSLDPKRYTPERCAKERGWDCFDEKQEADDNNKQWRETNGKY
jgi:hypothetical protein